MRALCSGRPAATQPTGPRRFLGVKNRENLHFTILTTSPLRQHGGDAWRSPLTSCLSHQSYSDFQLLSSPHPPGLPPCRACLRASLWHRGRGGKNVAQAPPRPLRCPWQASLIHQESVLYRAR